MYKWQLPERLKLKKKTNIDLSLYVLLFLIFLSLNLWAVELFENLNSPAQKELPVSPLLSELGPEEQPEQEVRPAGAGEGVSVSRGDDVGVTSRSDVVLLAQVIEAEASGESYSGKVAVGAVVVNRTKSPDFPKTIPGVIYERDAFESVSNGHYLQPVTNEALQAATEAVSGADPAGGALYFWNPTKSSSEWVYTRQITGRIGNHVFAR
ncbi:MAG: Spore cortex-lytic enzyme precursor [Pelotomaculum sp. PtaB.Bin104]|nr:MAG: Spore cortex-lytic enzyme precursor [Pelotomaculum sp. PtaB.Bin104]